MTAEVGAGVLPSSAEDAMRIASEMVPVLKERAADTEKIRRIPHETVRDILSSGLVRIGVPKRFGGLDVRYGAILEVAAELARGCASTAWCYALWSAHAWMAGHWPLRAQEEVFADGMDVLCSSAFDPKGASIEPVDGGFRLSGRWEFSSGCDAASWLMLGVERGAAWTIALVPREECEIIDTWFVSGLCGTGSKDIAIENTFVPHYRLMNMFAASETDWTGWEIHGQARYRMPLMVLLGWDLVAPIVGIAQAMIDEFTARLSGTSGPGRTADSGPLQLCLSEASAELDAARALLRHDIDEMFQKAKRGEAYTLLERARYRRDKAFVTQLCLQSVNRLFDLSGGHALFDHVALQRYHRDAQAVAHRDGLIMALGGLTYGRVALGLDP